MNGPDYWQVTRDLDWLESQPVEFRKSSIGQYVKKVLDKEKSCITRFETNYRNNIWHTHAFWVIAHRKLLDENPLVTKTPQFKEAMHMMSRYTDYQPKEDLNNGTRT